MSKIEEAERENPHKKLAGSMRVEWLTNPRDDHLSHWMLRLCYAENRDQFVNLEGHLFKVRLEQKTMNMDIESRAKFALEILLRYYRSVDYHVEEQYQKENRMEYLKIPFEDAISMMSEHRVIIKQGYGYIPRKFYLNLVRLLFGRNLRQEMTQIGEYLMEIVSKDERLKKLIDTIPKMAITKDFIKTDYSSKRGNINISDIGTMASLHYPLCMKEMHDNLMNKHHLRHYARLQYGSFLKGIGVKMEDAKQFFKREFSKGGNPKKLNEYMYYIEHMYGKKGKGTDYTPWGCNKMINQNAPASGEVHGCPFEFYGEGALKSTLLRQKMSLKDIEDILTVWKSPTKGKVRNPGDACKKHFNIKHPNFNAWDGVGRHPNSYFDSSMNYKKRFDNKTLQVISEDEGAKSNKMDEEGRPVHLANLTEST